VAEIVGTKNIKTSPSDCFVYGFDAGLHRRVPDAVVQPENTAQIAAIVRLANTHDFAVIPRGAGTALCGHTTPIAGGIIIDMQKMNNILDIRPSDLLAVVQPGVVSDRLNAALKPFRFFIPGPASSEAATIGGMVSTNASGDKALKYGATRDYVLGLEAVMPDGGIARFGSPTLKNSSGYQLARLLVGAEGTLGIVTEVTLRMTPLPETTAACVASFEALVDAGRTVSRIVTVPIFPAQLELMCDMCIQAVNKATGMGLPECGGILLIACDGHPETVQSEIACISEICRENGAFQVDTTDDPGRIAALWRGRKALSSSLSALRPDYSCVMLADDMAVPVSRVPEAIERILEIQNRYDILIPPYGHAGDGNLHTKVLLDVKNIDHWHQAEAAVRELYDMVLDLGGTVSGEHGVAISKAEYFHKECASAIPYMAAIKNALDPNNIMNPCKSFQWEGSFLSHLRYPVKEYQ
ncbi:MAG TPA: FAD-binding oxidoreductase, partial [bacterium]|nr:FAD-binding oxidoreductase [bacterium]